MSIEVLSQLTTDRIAAGEVVERPCSVVKELVENSLDAGSLAVSVAIKNGGLSEIRVTDNGSGIPKEEVPKAFLPHATSKLRVVEDLSELTTMGFRGEALPSISSVSEVEMITKVKDSVSAYSYELRGGKRIEEKEIGAPDGTTVFVRNLFFNTPARRKFMKSPLTEGSIIGEQMERFSLARPDVRFKFTVNGTVKFVTNGTGSLDSVIHTLYGRETAESILPVSYTEDKVTITGFVGKPAISRGTRQNEIYFVNNRYVRSKIIEKAIEDAYGNSLMLHRYPFTVLHISLSPSSYDINVHPAKIDIRFDKEDRIYDIIKTAVINAFSGHEFIEKESIAENVPSEINEPDYSDAPEPFETNEFQYESESRKSSSLRESSSYETLTDDLKSSILKKTEFVGTETFKEDFSETFEETFPETFLSRIKDKKYHLIGQIFRTYCLIESEDQLYLMDQHAAHEKVLYEKKMREFSEKKVLSQKTSPPILFSVSEKEDALISEHQEVFNDFGFEIRSLGNKEYGIFAVPSGLTALSQKELFLDILAELSEPGKKNMPSSVVARIAMASCKAAVKGNESISEAEALHLLSELLTLENPYFCPHGRPTVISFTQSDIEKRFKRIV